MKKAFAFTASLLLAASLTACGSSAGTATTAAAKAPETTAAATTAAASSEAASTEAAKTAAPKTATGKFTVGFDQEFPPMGFVGDNGEYTGFDLELAEEVAKRLNLEFVAQPINWDAKDMELESGNVDCIWNGFTMSGREDGYTWVGPYMANEQVFVVAGDSAIKTQADLAGKAIEAQKDSSAIDALKDEKNKTLTASFGSVTEVADYNTALMDLESGACDAVCIDSIVAGYQIATSGKNFRMLDQTLSEEEYGIGFKKGNTELADAVKGALDSMAKDGTLEKTSTKWFSKNVITLK